MLSIIHATCNSGSSQLHHEFACAQGRRASTEEHEARRVRGHPTLELHVEWRVGERGRPRKEGALASEAVVKTPKHRLFMISHWTVVAE